jgi:two-component system heavy metal sensor histidine kinase CusS
MRWPSASIAARLTFGLGLVSVLVFCAAGVLLHRALEAELACADAAKLRGKVSVVQHFVDEAARAGDWSALFHHLDDLRIGHEGLHVWLIAATGEVIYGGPPRPPELVDELTAPLSTASPWPGSIVRVASDVSPRQDLLRRHLTTLVVVCALGVAATVALSWFAIKHCLRIVTRLSREAGSVSPRSVGRRLSTPPEGFELTGLVKAFNHALDRLEAAYEQMQAFNANVAHELRTPLAALVTGTQVALSSSRSPEELRESLMSNLEELEVMKGLVSDMLFLSRADRGDRAEGLEQVALGLEADKAIHYCEAMLLEAHGNAQRVGDALVLCNPPLVRRAIVNLLTNAIRHTAPQGVIRICIDSVDGLVRLSVDNPGEPIPQAVRTSMFDRFYSAGASAAGARPGNGLGLAIVAAIARMHGGAVFSERSGKDNRIGFTLSAQPAQDDCLSAVPTEVSRLPTQPALPKECPFQSS